MRNVIMKKQTSTSQQSSPRIKYAHHLKQVFYASTRAQDAGVQQQFGLTGRFN